MDSFIACNLCALLKCLWNSAVSSDSNNVLFSGRWKSSKSFPILSGPLCPLSTYSNQYKWQCVILASWAKELKNALICMKTKVKRLVERAAWAHRPSPLIPAMVLCDILALAKVTGSQCAPRRLLHSAPHTWTPPTTYRERNSGVSIRQTGARIDTVNLEWQTMWGKREGEDSGSSMKRLQMSAPYPSSLLISECKNYGE